MRVRVNVCSRAAITVCGQAKRRRSTLARLTRRGTDFASEVKKLQQRVQSLRKKVGPLQSLWFALG